MGFGVTELLIILAIALVLFGSSKLKNFGGDLGEGIKSFRKAVREADDLTEEKKVAADPSAASPAAGGEGSGSGEGERRA